MTTRRTHQLSRRAVLQLGAGAAACWAAGLELTGCRQPEPQGVAGPQPTADGDPQPRSMPGPTAGKRRAIPIGVQLYSVRDDCAKDLAGVLAALSEMGYQGVEFAGYYDRPANELRRMLADTNLKCCGTHIGLAAITGDALPATMEFNQALGNRYLIVASLPGERFASVAALQQTADLFTEAAERARPAGLRVGYHAHANDFKKVENRVAWDVFFQHTGRDVIMQLDTSNCRAGGADPLAVLEAYPGRAVTVHLKEHGGPRGAVIGEGELPWPEILELCETTGGTEWYIVEHEVYARPPLESVRACLENLRKLAA